MKNRQIGGYGLVLIAACLWATMGLFYKSLMGTYTLSPLSIIFWRVMLAAAALFIVLGIKQREALHIARRDWGFFVAFGLLGIATFYSIYIYAIKLTGMGVAAVLMYTAPAWVTVLSACIFNEPLTARKGTALLLAVAGCALVGGIYDLGTLQVNLLGILAGLGAGLTYGLYILFCKSAAQRGYSAWGALAYALGIGTLFLLPLQAPSELIRAVTTPGIFLWLLILGMIPTLGGGIAFNAGLQKVPASNASIIATLEPAIATLLGWAFMGEQITLPQALGTGLILGAVLILQVSAAKTTEAQPKQTAHLKGKEYPLCPQE